MFEQSLVASTPRLRTHSRWPAVASVCIQSALVATLLTLPLMHPEVLPLTAPHLMRLVPPPPPRPPQTPPRPLHVLAMASNTAPSAPALAPATNAPLIHTSGQSLDEPQLAIGQSIGPASKNPFATLGPSGPASPYLVVDTGTGGPHPSAAPNISRGVSAGLLLEPIRPVYPQIARITHTEGTVIIQAIISKSGHIESAHVLSGPTILQASALQAVRDARYKPYLLNSQPTEVETTISITFHIGS